MTNINAYSIETSSLYSRCVIRAISILMQCDQKNYTVIKGARGFLKPFKRKDINRMRPLHNVPCSYAFFNIRFWRPLFRAQGQCQRERVVVIIHSSLSDDFVVWILLARTWILRGCL